jgi:hypothetical protein
VDFSNWNSVAKRTSDLGYQRLTARPLKPLMSDGSSSVPRIFFSEGGSTNSAEDRGQTERGSVCSSPLVCK